MNTVHAGICLLLAAVLLPGAAISQAGRNTINNNKSKEVTMTVQQNKEVIRQLFNEAINGRNMALLQHFVSPRYTGPGGKKGPAGFEEPVAALIKAFPDIQWKLEELIGEGNKVVVRWTWVGTHKAQFNNFAATGKRIESTAIAIYELENGKVASAQLQNDRLGFLQALGVVPAGLGAPQVTPHTAAHARQ